MLDEADRDVRQGPSGASIWGGWWKNKKQYETSTEYLAFQEPAFQLLLLWSTSQFPSSFCRKEDKLCDETAQLWILEAGIFVGHG